ncbi:hypothetical protein PAAG_12060 [Paracoccidioides lutzii Pb01]|uniref:Uncharacterized protein n=1 Tax=Paracoccidioides lutzii (strain ATCC MYA-826 / Pb01) TaxID=502779 RepID=A0A0A2V4E7_PARBA|nr:hypothetical protein PAAG_12060 [Paracoccidioides lutzii Pb01]KGQ01202.1 hypothetical protein PAAG_12060 [Paracoccidioides lutzii Pb01]
MLHRRFDESETAFSCKIPWQIWELVPSPIHSAPSNPNEPIPGMSLHLGPSLQPLGGSSPAPVFAWLEHSFNRIQPEMCNFD